MASEKKKKEAAADYSEMKLEEIFKRLEDAASELENGELSLEDSFRLYQEGMIMIKSCRDKIDTVEKNMQVLDEKGVLNDFQG